MSGTATTADGFTVVGSTLQSYLSMPSATNRAKVGSYTATFNLALTGCTGTCTDTSLTTTLYWADPCTTTVLTPVAITTLSVSELGPQAQTTS